VRLTIKSHPTGIGLDLKVTTVKSN